MIIEDRSWWMEQLGKTNTRKSSFGFTLDVRRCFRGFYTPDGGEIFNCLKPAYNS